MCTFVVCYTHTHFEIIIKIMVLCCLVNACHYIVVVVVVVHRCVGAVVTVACLWLCVA